MGLHLPDAVVVLNDVQLIYDLLFVLHVPLKVQPLQLLALVRIVKVRVCRFGLV